MAKHDLKAQKIQVERILNKQSLKVYADTPLAYAGSVSDLTESDHYITREFVEEYVGDNTSEIYPWDVSEQNLPVNVYRSHVIEGVEYLFRHITGDNNTEPALVSVDWAVIGAVGGSQDLQEVTEIGAVTNRALTISGFEGVDYSIDGIKIQIDPDDESGGILRAKSGIVGNGLFFSPSSTGLLFQNLVDEATELSLNAQTEFVAGMRLINTRLQVAPAINGNEAVTLNQLDSLVGENFEKIPFTGSTGIINIDFTINDRGSKFPNPDIRAYNVTGSIEDKIIGFNEKITRSGANISTVELNYIAGDGYILLTNN